MNLPIEPPKSIASTSRPKSNSISSSSALSIKPWVRELDKRLWRAIDFLHITVMFFSIYTAIIVAILRNELFEQCPLYAELYLRDNATHFSTDTIDRRTVWGSVYTCEFASFSYLSAFVVSFISLWIHLVFRRVVRTERLLRLPIGLITLIFALLTLVATSIVTDGVIKFCLHSQNNICTSSGAAIFSRSRWKIISLPAGGWLTTLSILLNALVRGFQLFSKPKKSPEALKSLLNQLMANRHQQKLEKEDGEHESDISRPSREKTYSQSIRQYSNDPIHNREFSRELYPYYYPPVPQYRQIEKRSRFQRICCPCFRRRRRRRRSRHSLREPYRPYVVPEEYFHRLNHLKQNGTVPTNLCHRHSMHHPVEQQTQTDIIPQGKRTDGTVDIPILGRRRSSVRFEDESPVVIVPKEPPNKESNPPVEKKDKEEEEEEEKETTSPVSENDLQRSVSFRNNEDDLWTTITINTEQSAPIQSSHFNRLSLENLSHIDTSKPNNDNGITAIHVNSGPTESVLSETTEKEMPPKPSFKTTRHRSTTNHHKPPSSRSHTTSSEDDVDLRNIKPVEEINAIVADKYNYNDLSKALKSNVERLKGTFIHAQEKKSHYDKPNIIRPTLPQKSNINKNSSSC